MPYQSAGCYYAHFLVDVMMNGFDSSNWNYDNDSDLSMFIKPDDSIDLINLEEPIDYPAHTGLVSLSVSSFVWNTNTCRFSTLELKLGCPCGVFCPLSISSEYLFLCARRKFGFNKKIGRNLLIVYVYYQPNFCTTV
jgi:hypothetical protein